MKTITVKRADFTRKIAAIFADNLRKHGGFVTVSGGNVTYTPPSK